MNKNVKETNPLRKAALDLGIMQRGQRDTSMLPVKEYLAIANELLNNRPRGGNPLSDEGGQLIGRAMLTGKAVSAISYICVSDYVGGDRYKAQGRSFALTVKEADMLARARRLRALFSANGCTLEWRLVLADGWGLVLYPDRVLPGGIDAYYAFMLEQCSSLDFQCIRWTEFMERNSATYRAARESLTDKIDKQLRWELKHGETAHDKPNKNRAEWIAEQHILMRAAEGAVMVDQFGPTIVLSTENRRLRQYDNLVVQRNVYNFVDYMPYYPHRMDAATACGGKC
ncbi:MAG: hypothetical protein ABIG66_03280 [Candidatus Kerfeldbacteria bacterium]